MSIKTIKIYDKNGNEVTIPESIKSAFVGNGFSLKRPKQENQSGEENGK